MNSDLVDNGAAIMVCTRCTAAVMVDDQFCPECGCKMTFLPPANCDTPTSPVADTCQRCSATKQHGDSFCSNCGQRYASNAVPQVASPQVMPVAVPATLSPQTSRPVLAVSTPAVRPVSSVPKAVDTIKSKPFIVATAGALLFIVFICIVSRAGQGQQPSNAAPAYNAPQLSAALPIGTPAPVAVPAAPGPLSAEDQQAFYQYSAQGLSLGNYLWCRQTLLATGEPLSNVTSYLVSLKHAADTSAEDLHVVASAGCQIAAVDGSIARAQQQVEVLTEYEARFPGTGIFQIAENAATGKPYRADLARTRMSLDGLAGSQLDTASLQETVDDIAAAGATRTGSHRQR